MLFHLSGSAGSIFTAVVLPILLLAALGALVQRFYPLDMITLSRLNIYIFIPAFLLTYLFKSTLTAQEIGGVVGAVVTSMALVALPLWLVMRAWGARGTTIGAVLISGVIFNAGNYGIPVAELRFGKPGAEVQAMVVVVSNISIWFVGYLILSLAKGRGFRGVLGYFRLPMIYVIGVAFALRWLGLRPEQVPRWIDYPLTSMGNAVIPLSLITLGAQLAHRARWPNWRLVGPVLGIKLVLLPLVTAGVVWTMNLWPWPGAQIINASAAPTAVNTLLLTLELDGDADTAADCVFWTTILSAFSVALILALLAMAGGAPPA